MTTVWSCHLIDIDNDRRCVHDFIDTDSFHWGGISTLF